MKTCLYCKGDLETKNIALDKRWRGTLFVIEGVPALVCRQCGEVFLDGPVAEQIDEMVKSGQYVRQVVVPVFEYKAA
ncbi:MAG: YgiT-type zinc finger protein [bacterium]